jgi:hypothetical protein
MIPDMVPSAIFHWWWLDRSLMHGFTYDYIQAAGNRWLLLHIQGPRSPAPHGFSKKASIIEGAHIEKMMRNWRLSNTPQNIMERRFLSIYSSTGNIILGYRRPYYHY